MPSSERGYRSSVMDRVFADTRVVALVGPSAGLDPMLARAALTAAEKSSERPRLALDPRSDIAGWAYRTGIADGAVEDRRDLDTSDLGAVLTAIRRRPGPRLPLEAVVAGDYLAVDYSHGIGDGQLGVMMMAVLSADPNGSLAPTLADGLPDGAIRKALWAHYSRKPRAIRQFWKLRGAHRVPAEQPTRTIDDWEDAKISRARYMAPAQVAELARWATENAPGATPAAVSIALWSAALRAENVATAEHVMVLFNSRRYLGRSHAAAHGNFAVGIPLRLPAGTPANAISAEMRRVIDSGWPVAVLGMAQLKAALRRGRSSPSATDSSVTHVPNRLRLAVSDLGALPMFAHLPPTDDARPRQLAASLEPDGPDGVTLLIAEIDGGRTYTASFCEKMVDATVIDAALGRLCDDPVALLSDSRRPA